MEDEHFHRENLRRFVDEFGVFHTYACENVDDALSLISRINIDVVITDIVMPNTDGIDFLYMLKNAGYLGISAIISAHANFDFAKNAIDLRVYNYLLKPFTKNELKNLLNGIIKQLDENNNTILHEKSKEFQKNLKKLMHEETFEISNLTGNINLINPGYPKSQLPNCRVLVNDDSSYEVDEKFLPILKHIVSNLDKDISLESVASAFYFNKNYFSTYFKDNVGINFNRYVNILKLEKSLYLLKETNNKVGEIALVCGFRDVKYFSKQFRKVYGISPVEYRRNQL